MVSPVRDGARLGTHGWEPLFFFRLDELYSFPPTEEGLSKLSYLKKQPPYLCIRIRPNEKGELEFRLCLTCWVFRHLFINLLSYKMWCIEKYIWEKMIKFPKLKHMSDGYGICLKEEVCKAVGYRWWMHLCRKWYIHHEFYAELSITFLLKTGFIVICVDVIYGDASSNPLTRRQEITPKSFRSRGRNWKNI